MVKQLGYHPIRKIFDRFHEAEAEPKGELDHVNAYTLVVAVALSAQATDVGVNKATRELFQIADTPEKMLELGEEGLIEHIKTIGLFRQKAKNAIKLSRILVDDYGGSGAKFSSGASVATGCGAQDRECRVEHVVGCARSSGRHAYLSCGQSHRYRGWKRCECGRARG